MCCVSTPHCPQLQGSSVHQGRSHSTSNSTTELCEYRTIPYMYTQWRCRMCRDNFIRRGAVVGMSLHASFYNRGPCAPARARNTRSRTHYSVFTQVRYGWSCTHIDHRGIGPPIHILVEQRRNHAQTAHTQDSHTGSAWRRPSWRPPEQTLSVLATCIR